MAKVSVLLQDLLIKRGVVFISNAFESIDHPKFFVVMGEKDSVVGYFYINSGVNRYVASNQESMAMQMPIRRSDYPDFLTHNSFIAGHQLAFLTRSELRSHLQSGKASYKGELTPDDLERLLYAARSSKLFTNVEKATFFKP